MPQGQFICPKEVKTRGPWPAEAGWGGHIAENGYKYLELADIS